MNTAQAANPLAFLQRATAIAVQADIANRDLTMRQLAILLHLVNFQGPAPSIKDLAARFGLSKPATTRSVDRLADVVGFVSRVTADHDRRMVEVRITSAGATYVNDLIGGLRGAA